MPRNKEKENFSPFGDIFIVVMKRFLSLAFIIFGLFAFSNSALAQRDVESNVERDPILEADAKHNLEVAWQYFRTKKAYKAVLLRAEETIAAHPEFSKIDEVLYLAGMSSLYLSNNKGKQKIDLVAEKDKEKYAPEKLREDATAYLSMLVENHPQSKYKDEAQGALNKLKARQ